MKICIIGQDYPNPLLKCLLDVLSRSEHCRTVSVGSGCGKDGCREAVFDEIALFISEYIYIGGKEHKVGFTLDDDV